MKTLTITEDRKNLSHWLAVAADGDDVGIILEAEIIALRKVEVEATDPRVLKQLKQLDKDERIQKLLRSGSLW